MFKNLGCKHQREELQPPHMDISTAKRKILKNRRRGQAFVTVSVDDGHPKDFRTAELLRKYGIPATFYVPARNIERPVMARSELQELAAEFELGGHTMNHVRLDRVPTDRAWKEIADGKHWLEDLVGRRIRSFCYPSGKHNACIARLVMNAGFRGARTCLLNRQDLPAHPFMWGVSTQAHRHTKFVQIRHAALEGNVQGLANYFYIYKGEIDWAKHFLRAVGWVQNNGGIAHLYLHSWEIEANDEWDQLESTFRLIGSLGDVKKVTNGELFGVWYKHDLRA